MWRSLFLAIAVTLCLLGLECLIVKRATLTLREPAATSSTYDYDAYGASLASTPAEGTPRVIDPPEWAPFGLLSSGIVLLLYSKSLGSG